MGVGACSSLIHPREQKQWKAVLTYESEGIIHGYSSREQLEFRTLLEYPIARQYISKFLNTKAYTLSGYKQLFICWVKIRQYDELPQGCDRLSEAKTLYKDFIRKSALLNSDVQFATDQRLVHGADQLIILIRAFEVAKREIFTILFDEVYDLFRNCPEYEGLKREIKETYNNVDPTDFDYIKVIGKGAYGLVCEARKKSTGTHYAVKIQSKEGIVKMFGDEPWRACLEMRTFASCKHPFIVDLCCAYQTDALLVLVMSLGTWCDLAKVLKIGGPLSHPHVLFYSAEITSALCYLHNKHFVYRDLKPDNVLLNADGHVQLVDFGLVCDLSGNLLAKCVPTCMMGTNSFQDQAESQCESPLGRTRAKSVVGTYGYMAPEMVVLLGSKCTADTGCGTEHTTGGYTKAVDWWSLGVLVYKLLVGEYPFRCGQDKKTLPTWDLLSEPVNYSMPAVNDYPATKDFISSLLRVNDTERLGAEGLVPIRQHPFYASIDWTALESKHIVPPDLPTGNVYGHRSMPTIHGGLMPKDKPSYSSLEHMLESHNHSAQWLEFGYSEEEKAVQHHFAMWDYISPSLITTEIQYQNKLTTIPDSYVDSQSSIS